MHITLRQLSVFTAIADHTSVTQASDFLALSQAAASMSLKELEQQLGTHLFDRNGKRLILNEHGRRFYPIAQQTLLSAKEAESLFKQDLACNLRLGASSTIGAYALPPLMAKFLELEKNSQLQLKVANSEQILEWVANFQLDLGLIEGPLQHPDVCIQPWKEDELIFICSNKHPLAQQTKISIDTLQHQRWIMREQGSGTRVLLEQFIAPYFGTPEQMLEIGNAEGIKHAVIANAGIACVSKQSVLHELELGIVHPIQLPGMKKLTRTFYLALHKEKYSTQGLKRFIQFINR
ncbi:LysR family transcriptional regulator [Pseudomonas sp. F1_0610]|uniref:LysR family transcriptional regulator n=1 Tax=Pseudomonas sp. F1_0610 TaxID=3114284 RepID=UPI0039C3ADB7